MCSCSTDYAAVSSTEIRRARKIWHCGECRKPIGKGHRYIRWSTLYDGHWSDGAICLPCNAVRSAHCAIEGCYPAEGDLGECIRDCGGEPGYLEKLRGATKANLVCVSMRLMTGFLREVA